MRTNQVWVGPPGVVAEGDTIAFEYKSRAWVRPAASGLGNGDTLGVDGQSECIVIGDYPLFDPLLLQYGIKLMFKKEKGFDTTTAEADFLRAMNGAQQRASAGAPAICLTPTGQIPILGYNSLGG